ncbi:MAG: tetratricopeptide repeat protein [Saprospiraceae bacterium]
MDNTERIDRYLSGAMDATEQQRFEQELSDDAQLVKDLAVQRDMAHFLQHQAKKSALQTQLQGIGGEYFKPQQAEGKIIPMPRRRWIGIASAVAAAAVILLLLWQFWSAPSLYGEFAQHPQLALSEKSVETPNWVETETAFQSGDYAKAETQLIQYTDQFPNDPQARLYLGICKMELDKTAEARLIFQDFAGAEASLKDYADWYLALNELKAGNEAACRTALKAIAPASSFFDRAQLLLERLDGGK